MNQQDLDFARQKRDEAIARVGAHAVPEWNDAADQAIELLARGSAFFTTDEVWAIINPTGAKTHEPRAMGAAIRRARQKGLIQPTDRFIPSKRSACNCRPLRVWEVV